MNPKEIYQQETGENWWTKPVCHGEYALPSTEYVGWLENNFERTKSIVNSFTPVFDRENNVASYFSVSLEQYIDLLNIFSDRKEKR